MEVLDKTYDRACCEIDDILKHQKFDNQDVGLLGELIDIVKDVEMIYGYQDGMNMDEYSGTGMRGRSDRMMSYGRGSSYARGRSMNGGYSRNTNKDMMLDHLQNVADMAMDEKDRRAIEKLMSQMSEN